jgi:5-methylcytosine-specific restriction endonuclease McrA
MKRDEFTKNVRAEAFARCGGRCEKCAAKLKAGEGEYDHIVAYFLTQDSTLSNCQVLCVPCHRGVGAKTADDQRMIAKVKRVKAKFEGTFHKASGFQSRFKRKVNGDVIDTRTGEVVGQ